MECGIQTAGAAMGLLDNACVVIDLGLLVGSIQDQQGAEFRGRLDGERSGTVRPSTQQMKITTSSAPHCLPSVVRYKVKVMSMLAFHKRSKMV